jgi:(2Fe-2S) ferredoxin
MLLRRGLSAFSVSSPRLSASLLISVRGDRSTGSKASCGTTSAAAVAAPGDDDNCETCGLSNTVKPYDIHISFCSDQGPYFWPKDVEEDDVVVHFKSILADSTASSAFPKRKVKFNFCSYSPTDKYVLDMHSPISLLVFPQCEMYSFVPSKANIEIFFSHVLGAESTATALPSDIAVSTLPWSKILLVCCHGNRDMRCGRMGPQVVDELRNCVEQEKLTEVQVLECSHLGGHRFAGTMVSYPSGNWFGNVNKDVAKELLYQSVIRDNILPKYFRGNAWKQLNKK